MSARIELGLKEEDEKAEGVLYPSQVARPEKTIFRMDPMSRRDRT